MANAFIVHFTDDDNIKLWESRKTTFLDILTCYVPPKTINVPLKLAWLRRDVRRAVGRHGALHHDYVKFKTSHNSNYYT